MKKKKVIGLSLNKKKVSILNQSISSKILGGTGYESCGIACGTAGCGSGCISSGSCSLPKPQHGTCG